ncbi:uncharacterized protein TNCV_4386891 [Trichonephila clavipes]|nr:uncharacterized protein TNCV_4386891 [Trichonephila clavipes]
MTCDAEDCGFQMLRDDEIVTSVQDESDPVNDETDEAEDNTNNESSKGPSNADAFSTLETAMEWTVIRNAVLEPITSSREDKHVTHMALMDRATTSRALSQEPGSFARQQVSARKVRRRLLQHGLSARKPWLRLPLTLHHHQDDHIRVRWHRGERTLAACIRHRHTGPLPDMMVWGAIKNMSRSPLVRIDDTLSSAHYISGVLQPVALPFLRVLRNPAFKQDNARPHVAFLDT